MKIILLGYMGSGKSTIGFDLQKQLNMPSIDLDSYIEKNEKLSIEHIFSIKGEIYFRKIENTYLKELLHSEEDIIISLGGGTPCYADNMEAILKTKDCTSIYLQASIKTLETRLVDSENKRPLIADISKEGLTEYIAKHLFERRAYYEQSNLIIKVDGKDRKAIGLEIQMKLA